jgi:polyketide synthase 7
VVKVTVMTTRFCPLDADSHQELRAAAARLAAELSEAAQAGTQPGTQPGQAGTQPGAQPGQADGLAGEPCLTGTPGRAGAHLGAHRAVVRAADGPELVERLSALAAGSPGAGVHTARAVPAGPGPVFVFPGQGSQWPGMGVELYDRSPVFRDTIDAVGAQLRRHADWSLLEVLAGEPGAPPLDRVDVVQPALFAMMVALARLWLDAGVQPAAVLGHSQGEIAAAYVAGALSLSDAVRVVALRGRVLRRLEGRGGMLSVPMPYEWVAGYVAERRDRLAVAVESGPGGTVVSGDVPALETLERRCAQEGVRARFVRVNYPSHSPQIDEVRDELLAGVGAVTPRPETLRYYSPVAGGELAGSALTPDYWYQNLRRTVRFETAARAAVAAGHTAFIEVSPHPTVARSLRRILGDAGVVAETLRREYGGPEYFLDAVAQAAVTGAAGIWPPVPVPSLQVTRAMAR